MVDNKTFNTLKRIKLIKHVQVSNIQSLLEILERMLPLNTTIIQQSIPHHLMGFLHELGNVIDYQIIPLALDNPQETVC